jgi:hypothetical protein
LESDHRKTKILISALVDGELKDCEKKNLILHLNECTKCQTEYKSVLALKLFLDKIKELGMPR